MVLSYGVRESELAQVDTTPQFSKKRSIALRSQLSMEVLQLQGFAGMTGAAQRRAADYLRSLNQGKKPFQISARDL